MMAPITRTARTPAELLKLAAACRKDAADTRRALPRTRESDQELMRARVYRLERLASELERAAQRAAQRAEEKHHDEKTRKDQTCEKRGVASRA